MELRLATQVFSLLLTVVLTVVARRSQCSRLRSQRDEYPMPPRYQNGRSYHGLKGTKETAEKVLVYYNTTDYFRGPSLWAKRMIVHPIYTPSRLFDIALLKLQTPLRFDSFVKPVCLPKRKFSVGGKPLRAAGWGRPRKGKSFSKKLLYESLFGAKEKRCKELTRESFRGKRRRIFGPVICTEEPAKATCQGDSGGPVSFLGANGQSIQVGIVTAAMPCIESKVVGKMFVRVSGYMHWIKKAISRPHKWRKLCSDIIICIFGIMKWTATTVFLLLGCQTVLAAPEFNTSKGGDSCDFVDMDLDIMVDSVVKQLPREFVNPSLKLGKVIPGLTFGNMTYTGLDKLKPYGPVLPYCRDGLRLVQVDLANTDEELVVNMPWEYCGGQKGELGSRAKGRITVTFRVPNSSSSDGPKLLYHSGPTLVTMEKMSMYLYGAGDVAGSVFATSRVLFPEVPKSFWQDLLTHRLGVILKEMS